MKKTKRILIFQTGEPTHLDQSAAPMRLINLADKLLQHNYEVIVLTSRFYHLEKKFRDKKLLIENKEINVKYIFIESPGYEKNISIKRLYDHLVLAKNLGKVISNINGIDYVFMGYPPIEACFVLSRWCLKYRIPYIVDYKDLWPELFTNDKNIFFKIFLLPILFILKKMRNFTLKNSSAISTISRSFLNDLKLDGIQKKKIVCYLTKKKNLEIDLKKIRKNITTKFPSEKIKIVFIGNFMVNAFDFKILKQIENFIKKSPNLEFYFFGSGPSKKEVEENLNFENVYIADRVNLIEFQYIMKNSQAVFLPIKNRFDYLKSIPNKIIDAIQYKLPIFTSLEGEVKSLVEKFKIGFFYKNHETLLKKLEWFSDHKNRISVKQNYDNSDLQTIFDHDLNYSKIINKIELDLKNKNLN